MGLLDDYARPCVLMVRSAVPGGEGGNSTKWEAGEALTVHMARNDATEARRAEKETSTSVFSALVRRDAPIRYGDFFKDTETGETYRVTSAPDEKQSPRSATFALKSFTAEKEALP